MRWLTLIIGFLRILAPPLSSADKKRKRVPNDQVRLRIYNNDGAYKFSYWGKTVASNGYRAACQQRTRDSRAEKLYVIYSHLPPDYGFSNPYTLSDHLERLYEEPPKLVTKDHHSTGKTVYRVGEYQKKSDQNCFIVANQTDTSGHGYNDLNGKRFVAGYFCMPHPSVNNRATLAAFLDRIAAGKIFKAARNPK